MAALVRFSAVVTCLVLALSVHAQVAELKPGPVTIEQLLIEDAELFSREQDQLQQNPNSPVILTIGDSITAFGYNEDGWATLLNKERPNTLFINRGMGMGNTRGSLVVSEWYGKPGSPLYDQFHRVQLVTFCFGANDASTNSKNATWRFVDPPEYKENLIKSIKAFQSHGVKNFLLLTPPPPGVPPRIDRRIDATAEYADICAQIGRELRIPVVDIFNGIMAVPNWRTTAMLPDGLHLAPMGQRIVYELVQQAVKANFPGV